MLFSTLSYSIFTFMWCYDKFVFFSLESLSRLTLQNPSLAHSPAPPRHPISSKKIEKIKNEELTPCKSLKENVCGRGGTPLLLMVICFSFSVLLFIYTCYDFLSSRFLNVVFQPVFWGGAESEAGEGSGEIRRWCGWIHGGKKKPS